MTISLRKNNGMVDMAISRLRRNCDGGLRCLDRPRNNGSDSNPSVRSIALNCNHWLLVRNITLLEWLQGGIA